MPKWCAFHSKYCSFLYICLQCWVPFLVFVFFFITWLVFFSTFPSLHIRRYSLCLSYILLWCFVALGLIQPVVDFSASLVALHAAIHLALEQRQAVRIVADLHLNDRTVGIVAGRFEEEPAQIEYRGVSSACIWRCVLSAHLPEVALARQDLFHLPQRWLQTSQKIPVRIRFRIVVELDQRHGRIVRLCIDVGGRRWQRRLVGVVRQVTGSDRWTWSVD